MFFQKLSIVILIILIYFPNKNAYSFQDDNLYDDPGINRIYTQSSVLEKIPNDLKKDLNNFTNLSALNQQKTLQSFSLLQEQLEQEYKSKKAWLANTRLAKYGFSCIVCLAVPILSINFINGYLPEEEHLSFGTLPGIALHGSGFFICKFLEIFSQKYIASRDGPLQEIERRYIRNKPLMDSDFCKVFERKLIVSHKNNAQVHDHLLWFDAALQLPLTKKVITMDRLNEKFEKEFSIFPPTIKQKIKKLCLRHMIQKHSRVIAYFYGPSGSGKTKCARSIARCLDLPFGSIALANYSVSDLIGQKGPHLPHPGKIAEAMLNAKNEHNQSYDNMVLLIDEADEILNRDDNAADSEGILSFLLTLLDPEMEYYYNPYFEKNVRIKDILIILGGIKHLKNDAMRKRTINIEFPGFEAAYKKEFIIKKYIPKLYKGTEKPYKLSLIDHFSEEDRKMLCQFIDEDNDPGLRTVQEKARQFVDEKIITVFMEDNL